MKHVLSSPKRTCLSTLEITFALTVRVLMTFCGTHVCIMSMICATPMSNTMSVININAMIKHAEMDPQIHEKTHSVPIQIQLNQISNVIFLDPRGMSQISNIDCQDYIKDPLSPIRLKYHILTVLSISNLHCLNNKTSHQISSSSPP